MPVQSLLSDSCSLGARAPHTSAAAIFASSTVFKSVCGGVSCGARVSVRVDIRDFQGSTCEPPGAARLLLGAAANARACVEHLHVPGRARDVWQAVSGGVVLQEMYGKN